MVNNLLGSHMMEYLCSKQSSGYDFISHLYTQAKKSNLVFRATVEKTLGRVGSVLFFVVIFLRIETSIIKTPTKKNPGIFVKKV